MTKQKLLSTNTFLFSKTIQKENRSNNIFIIHRYQSLTFNLRGKIAALFSQGSDEDLSQQQEAKEKQKKTKQSKQKR